MTPGQRDQVVAARAAERLDHIEVIAPRPIELLRKRIGVGADAVDLLRQKIDGLDQAGIAAKAEQRLVETQVAVENRQQLALGDGCSMLALELFQPVNILLRDRKADDRSTVREVDYTSTENDDALARLDKGLSFAAPF